MNTQLPTKVSAYQPPIRQPREDSEHMVNSPVSNLLAPTASGETRTAGDPPPGHVVQDLWQLRTEVVSHRDRAQQQLSTKRFAQQAEIEEIAAAHEADLSDMEINQTILRDSQQLEFEKNQLEMTAARTNREIASANWHEELHVATARQTHQYQVELAEIDGKKSIESARHAATLVGIQCQTTLNIHKIRESIKIETQKQKTMSAIEWRQYVHHWKMQLLADLPRIQQQFTDHYRSVVAARNGKVKHIRDDIILPELVCDGDPLETLSYIKPGSVKPR